MPNKYENLVKPNAKPEAEESGADEMQESPEMQKKEQREGTEEHPEEALAAFKMHVDDMLKDATPEQIEYLKECLAGKEGETKNEKTEFSMEGMEE
jgi:hypothetical protein